MPPIRILHISDLHIAEQPEHHSLLDQYASVDKAIKKFLLSDIKDAVLTGSPKNVRAAFSELLDEESIANLINTAKQVEREDVNQTIDDILGRIVLGDGSFNALAEETAKNWTLASSYNSGALDCLCKFIEEEDQSLDGVLITGDLATTGFDFDLEQARLFLEGDRPFDLSIYDTAARKMLLPGNHDRYIYSDGPLYAPGGKSFDVVFNKHWAGPVMTYPPFRDGKDLSVVVVAADFSLRSKDDCTLPFLRLSRLAQGRVYPEILDELETATRAAHRQERLERYTPIVLWAIHFPPLFVHHGAGPISRAINRLTKNLIDELKLVEKAKEHNVYAILAGHTHEAQDYDVSNLGVRILCAGSATQDDAADKQCQIIEVSRNRINQPRVSVTEYELDDYRSTFRPKTTRTTRSHS